MQTALRLREKQRIDILPVFVGVVTSGTYTRFGGFAIKFPDVRSKTCATATVRETMQQLFALQGLFLNPDDVMDKVKAIQRTFSYQVWPRYRAHWGRPEELGPERAFTCVQCRAEFTNSENGPGSCAFHSVRLRAWRFMGGAAVAHALRTCLLSGWSATTSATSAAAESTTRRRS